MDAARIGKSIRYIWQNRCWFSGQPVTLSLALAAIWPTSFVAFTLIIPSSALSTFLIVMLCFSFSFVSSTRSDATSGVSPKNLQSAHH